MSQKNIAIPDNPKILVVRTDRIGDAVLSLPVFASLNAAFPGAYIAALVREYTADIYRRRDDIDEVIAFDAPTHHIPTGAFLDLRAQIAAKKFDVAIALFSNFSVAALLAISNIPVRIGPATKLAQIFFTHKVTQRRSKLLRHEVDHNLDLLIPLGVSPLRRGGIFAKPTLPDGYKKNEERPLIGVHPGHGGSSPNWPEESYVELIRELYGAGCDVFVTGAPGEEILVDKIIKSSGREVNKYIGKDGLGGVCDFLAALDLFIAPSTGPLHLASAVGTKVIGLYSPIFVCLPERWGPIGKDDTAIRPEVEPCKLCVGPRCEHHDCMAMISVEQVKGAALDKVFPKVKSA